MQFDSLNTAADWPDKPGPLFDEWFRFVSAENVPEPEAMALATCTADGIPSVRMVLLRGYDERGFCFYTNYESRKGAELDANPHASAVFYWREPYLQVRIEGRVEKLTAEESDAYFLSRAREKRFNAIVSQQSRPIENWNELQSAAMEMEKSDSPANRPAHWGGFRIQPDFMEFWAGRPDRMHRRCAYRLNEDGSWSREMLAP